MKFGKTGLNLIYGFANVCSSYSNRLGYSVGIAGRNETSKKMNSVEEIVARHFDHIGEPEHVCRPTLEAALNHLDGRPSPVIVETGSSAWGTNSSILFDSYIESFGGSFHTVDIRVNPLFELRKKLGPNSRATCNDSVRFLNEYAHKDFTPEFDLLYLDSWDLDVSDPWPSAIHGLKELVAARPKIRQGTLLLIDDTPKDVSYFQGSSLTAAVSFWQSFGLVPGKGMIINEYLRHRDDVELLQHEYQVLYRFV